MPDHLAADVGGIPEIVSGTDTPLLPPGDAAACWRAMQAFLRMPAEPRRKRGDAPATAVAERFTPERMAERGAGVLCHELAYRSPALTLTEKLTARRPEILSLWHEAAFSRAVCAMHSFGSSRMLNVGQPQSRQPVHGAHSRAEQARALPPSAVHRAGAGAIDRAVVIRGAGSACDIA